jgi:hypothetical protein
MIYLFLFFILILIEVPNPNIQTQPQQPAICSITDILMSLSNPTVTLQKYFCHSA